MKFKKTFSETVKELREEKQLPLREVAIELEIGTSMLSKIEKNYRKPTKKLIEKFANYYKVNYKELTITYLSDIIAFQIMDEEDLSIGVLKVAEEKVKYLKTQKHFDK